MAHITDSRFPISIIFFYNDLMAHSPRSQSSLSACLHQLVHGKPFLITQYVVTHPSVIITVL
jgi:hypothetical protein